LMVLVVFSTVVSIGSGTEQLDVIPKKHNNTNPLANIRTGLQMVYKLSVVII